MKVVLKKEGDMDIILVAGSEQYSEDFTYASIKDFSEDGDSYDMWIEDNEDIETEDLFQLPINNQSIAFFSNYGDAAPRDFVICRLDFECMMKSPQAINWISVDDPDGFDMGQIVVPLSYQRSLNVVGEWSMASKEELEKINKKFKKKYKIVFITTS